MFIPAVHPSGGRNSNNFLTHHLIVEVLFIKTKICIRGFSLQRVRGGRGGGGGCVYNGTTKNRQSMQCSEK